MTDAPEINLTPLTVDIVSAYVANNALSADKLADLIGAVHTALGKASTQAVEPEKAELVPAVSIKKSVTHDFIICLEDGRKFKSLKRHLKTHYDLSPDDYREKWGLPRDYPMVAPAYAEARSNLAKSMGLGRVNGAKPAGTSAPEPKAAKAGGRRGRKAA